MDEINFYISYNILFYIFCKQIFYFCYLNMILFVSNQLYNRKSIILISISLILLVCRIFYQIEPTKLIFSHRKYSIYDCTVKGILNCLIRITANLWGIFSKTCVGSSIIGRDQWIFRSTLNTIFHCFSSNYLSIFKRILISLSSRRSLFISFDSR